MSHTTEKVLSSGLGRKVLYITQDARFINGEKSRFGGPVKYFGPGHLEGTTTVAGSPNLPKSCPVRIYDRETGQFVREVRSSETGVYRVDNLKLGVDYSIIAIDETGEHNAEIADRQRAKP